MGIAADGRKNHKYTTIREENKQFQYWTWRFYHVGNGLTLVSDSLYIIQALYFTSERGGGGGDGCDHK